MGIINMRADEDDQLPGSRTRVDLGTKICPSCRREALPWQDVCPTCDVATIPPDDVPATEIPLPPGLRDLDDDDDDASEPQ